MRLKCLFLVWLIVVINNQNFGISASATTKSGRDRKQDELPPADTLQLGEKHVVIDNGILQVTLAVPEGYVTGISFNGVDNLLETENEESNRGYWDVVWDTSGRCSAPGCTDRLVGTSFDIVSNDENHIEISFSSKWNPRSWDAPGNYPTLPINVDLRYVISRGLSGFYSYAILERELDWPEADIFQIRAVYKLQRDRFHYMAVSDERQRIMPMPQDRDTGEPLAFKEAVLLTNPRNDELKGEVDDKYQYSCDDKDNNLHGWISSDPPIGLWMITPSNEFRSAGPLKQDLTSHTGPITLAMFHSNHYAGLELTMKFDQGESWKKVFGPFFIYLNTASDVRDPRVLWRDAKQQMVEETVKWPYEFPASEDFPKSSQRGSVSGRLLVHEHYVKNPIVSARLSWVGLAARGDPGSWQTEAKGYQFWARADRYGKFGIHGIREGNYSLYAFVPGFIGDYKYEHDIHIEPGSSIHLGYLVFQPLRNGPTLWEIGFPDRTAAEFYVPDPSPVLLNKLYVNKIHEKFRQYGLWERYGDLYPGHDLVYNVESSHYRRDWFFAQVTRRSENNTYRSTTWQIIFPLASLDPSANYMLRLALASATGSEVQIRINDPATATPHFTTGFIGRGDNAIARHGIHGLYRLFNVHVSGYWLRLGSNTMYLTQTRSGTPFEGVMYDYIRLEGPPRTA